MFPEGRPAGPGGGGPAGDKAQGRAAQRGRGGGLAATPSRARPHPIASLSDAQAGEAGGGQEGARGLSQEFLLAC